MTKKVFNPCYGKEKFSLNKNRRSDSFESSGEHKILQKGKEKVGEKGAGISRAFV
jgi:hypothetical protein